MNDNKISQCRHRFGASHGMLGFALAPILYIIALAGIAGAVLFTGYTQILRSNVEITADNSVRNQIRMATEVIAAQSSVNNVANELVVPPSAVVAFNTLDAARLPRNAAGTAAITEAGVQGTALAVGGVAAQGGIRQLDPWGRYFVLCRWTGSTGAPQTGASMSIISAGADGNLATSCNDTVPAAGSDDKMEYMTVANVLSRSANWQAQAMAGNRTGYTFGIDPNSSVLAVGVDAASVDTSKSLDIGGNARFRTALQVDGSSVLGDGVGGDSVVMNAATAINSTLGVTGASTLGAVTAGATSLTSTLGVAGATTLAGLTASGATQINNTLGVTGATTVAGLTASGATQINNTLGVTGVTTLGTANITAGNIATANITTGNVGTANITTGNVAALTVTGASALNTFTAASGLVTGNLTVGGTITGNLTGNVNGNVSGSAGSVDGSNITGIVPLDHGGTGVAASSNANLRTLLSIQTQDADLQALSDNTATGFIRRTGAGTISTMAIQQSEVPAFTGATGGAASTLGGVPVAAAGQQNFVLTGNGIWTNPAALVGVTELTEGDSGVHVDDTGTGVIRFTIDGFEQARITGVASADRSVRITGGTAGVVPEVAAYASGGNSALRISALGSGSLHLRTNGSDRFVIDSAGNASMGGSLTSTGGFVGNLTGNASTATLLQTARNFSLTGDATATAVSFNGGAAVALATTVARLQGRNMLATAPNTNEALIWNGAAWAPANMATTLDGTTIGGATGVNIRLQDGSVGAPSLAFANDTNTGLFRYSAPDNHLAFSLGGVENIYLQQGNFDMWQDTGAAQGFTRLGASHYSTHAGSSAYVGLARARGTRISPAVVASGDSLGLVQFMGYGAGAARGYAEVRAYSTEAFTLGTGGGTMMVFNTTPNSSGSMRESMRINQDGYVGIGSTTGTNANLHVRHNAFTASQPLARFEFVGPIAGGRSLSILAPATDSASDFFTFVTGNGINFRTDTIDAISINSAGRVGINTTNPGVYQLNVNGNTNITGNLTVSGTVTGTGGTSAGGSNTQVQFNNSGVLAGSAAFVWDNTNRALTISRAAGAGSGIVMTMSDGTRSIFFNPHNTAGAWNPLGQTGDQMLLYSGGAVDTGALVIGPHSASNKGIRIAADGNVSIGNASSAGHKLTVDGTFRVGMGAVTNMIINGNATLSPAIGGTSIGTVITTAGTSTSSGHIGFEIPANDANDGFFVSTDSDLNGVADTVAIRAIANGNVGIGTATPGAYRLNVAGTGYFAGALTAAGTISSTGQVLTLSNAAGPFHLLTDSDAAVGAKNMVIQNAGGAFLLGFMNDANSAWSQPSMIFGSAVTGNIGIGNSNPGAYKLNVTGDTNITGNLTVSGTVTGTGGTTAAGSDTHVQFNNSGVLGGLANLTFNKSASVPSLGVIGSSTAEVRLQGAGGAYRLHVDNGSNLFRIFDNGGTARFAIDASGNVSVPAGNFSVTGNSTFTGNTNTTGTISGNGKAMFTTADTYLRMNESGAFSAGVWIGNSNIAGGSGIWAMGSNGGTTNSRVYINGGTYNGTNVINLNGTNGNGYFAGILDAGSQMRAPIMYDLNDGAFYVDPNATTRVNNLTVTGTLSASVSYPNNAWITSAEGAARMYFATNGVTYIRGTGLEFRNGSDTPIMTWGNGGTMSTNYAFSTAGNRITISGGTPAIQLQDTDVGGTRYVYNDGANIGFLNNGGNWSAYVNDSNQFFAYIMYDLDNTGYYVNPNSTSVMQQINASIIYDRDNGGYYLDPNGTSYSNVFTANDMRSDIWYDRNNTGYYIDGNNSSNLNVLTVNGALYTGEWVRVATSAGIYWTAYGGGWHMTDSTYLRAYNGKYVLAAGYYHTSDARMKHDIRPFRTSGLDTVEGLRAVHFKWNGSNKDDFGVIAQETEKVLPEAVQTDDKGFKQVQYDKLVLPVIEAVKELHAMVKDLVTKVADLLSWKDATEGRLLKLEERLNKVEAEKAALAKENAVLKDTLEKRLQALEGKLAH